MPAKPTNVTAEPKFVEVVLNVDKPAKGESTVYVASNCVIFIDGKTSVTEDVAQALKDANIIQ